METSYWRKCSTCKKDIGFNQKYYVCSVSTCNGDRTGYVFCSVTCCEAHYPGARHRDASAIEMRSPASAASPLQTRRIVPTTSTGPGTGMAASSTNAIPQDILIVASKLKDYIKAKADMNTSGAVMERLSDIVRRHCDQAIENARREGRKTVMDRDF